MSSVFRSEEMALCQLFLQNEAAYACVSELGELGLVEFKDLNSNVNSFQRKYVGEVRRCYEMERKLRYLEREIKKNGIKILDTGENPEAPQPREIIDLEATFDKLETELREVNHNAETLKRNFLELTELKHVLRKTQVFFDEVNFLVIIYFILNSISKIKQKHMPACAVALQMADQNDEQVLLLGEEGLRAGGQVLNLGFVAGVIMRGRIPAFERMLWRVCRGNVFLRLAEIGTPLTDPSTGEPEDKSVFIIFFQGDQLRSRVRKICEGFRATLYPCPEAPPRRREMAMGVLTRIEDLNTVLNQTNDHRHRVLVAAAKNIKSWFIKVIKIKAIYHTLNFFNLDVTQKCLIAECWVPLLDIETIQLALLRGTHRSGSSVPPILNRIKKFENPPTYNRTNKFTSAFQNLVDAYGIASYREINPAPYTIISFPFLFAVMFGDLGHGTLMFLFAAFLVLLEKSLAAKKNDNEVWNILFAGRYIILLMGLFAMYTGLIYNDIFSKSLNLFGCRWHTNYNVSTVLDNKFLQLNPALSSNYDQTPYPLGLDPVWQLAENKIVFLNAYKMKISIIFGVLHMLFGVTLSLYNYRYFNDRLSVYCEFIPQFIFLTSLFFYMVLLMFYKWITYGPQNDFPKSPACAPSILITFINMVLFKDNPPLEHCNTVYMFSGQETLQKCLVFVAVLCVPIMLFAKPICVMRQKEKHVQLVNGHATTENGNAERAGGGHGGHGENEIGELFIYQGIHTIEYVLGSVSHTASYLRLWALSLAHAQLSDVLWNMILRKAFSQEELGYFQGVLVYFYFLFWAILTVSILVLMEGLSAFLHTLRLHWVEFQSKFYKGLGYAFSPFSFEVILMTAVASTEE
ncbi:V-type proton ATPase 116 kDa subunit a 1-like [Adelges cooleyi]|uniref:V-type proton ATPase 116 kDa subunit a 1-like n=1 Tax=Adelges cooleyi TaxID=133065 RepID=UPI00217FC19E|nr:V-type proton ATPase 116 kDa subunit a 1-like [Adelges cooleyi]